MPPSASLRPMAGTRQKLIKLCLAVLSPIVALALAEALAFALGAAPLADDEDWQRQRQGRVCRTDWRHAEAFCGNEQLAQPGRKLVVTLGGSSVHGYPRGATIPFAVHLQRLLDDRAPETWRVVNRGLSCKDSIFVRECARATMALEPSLLVIYAGHNDFANWGEVDPAFQIWREELLWFYDLEDLLAHTRVYSLLTRMIRRDEPAEFPPRLPPAETAEAARGVVLAKFDANMKEVLELAARHGTRVILVTVVSNLHDYPVRRAKWDSATSQWAHERGDLAAWAGHFERGVELYAAGRFEAALEAFARARDANPRGRAHTELNDRVRALASAYPHVRLVDFERQLHAEHAASGIGCNFFGDDFDGELASQSYCDQFHPNTGTQLMIAQAVLEAMGELEAGESDPTP